MFVPNGSSIEQAIPLPAGKGPIQQMIMRHLEQLKAEDGELSLSKLVQSLNKPVGGSFGGATHPDLAPTPEPAQHHNAISHNHNRPTKQLSSMAHGAQTASDGGHYYVNHNNRNPPKCKYQLV